MAIEPVQIATNRNAPAGSEAIHLYNTDVAKNLTLGQLVGAVCLRAADLLERQSVNKMNEMNKTTESIEELSTYMEAISREKVDNAEWLMIRAKLEAYHNITDLPVTINSYADRMESLAAIKKRLDHLAQISQEDMIDLQTLMNRGNVAASTASNLAKSIQGSAQRTAERFK